MDKKDLAGCTGHRDHRDGTFGKSAQETLSEGESFFLYLIQNENDRRWLVLMSNRPPASYSPDNLGFR